MTQIPSDPPPGFDALTVDEQLSYVQSLWQRIAANPATIPVPQWHLNVIEARLPEYRNASQEGKRWDEVRAQVLGKLDRT